MLDLTKLDLEDLATALAEQGLEHRWFFNTETGETVFSTLDDDAAELDRDLIAIEPLPPRVWYRDMADFAEGISDEPAQRRLGRALHGRGAFRHFRNELHDEYPDLVSVWNAFRDSRAHRRAVEWLVDNNLVTETDVERYLADHPEPTLP